MEEQTQVNPNEIYDSWRAKFAELDNVNAIDYLLDLVLTTNRRVDELNNLNAQVLPQVEAAFQNHGSAIQELQKKVQELDKDKPRLLLP